MSRKKVRVLGGVVAWALLPRLSCSPQSLLPMSQGQQLIWGLPLSLHLLAPTGWRHSHQRTTNCGRRWRPWRMPTGGCCPLHPALPCLLQPVPGSGMALGGRQERGEVTEFKMNPRNKNPAAQDPHSSSSTYRSTHPAGLLRSFE